MKIPARWRYEIAFTRPSSPWSQQRALCFFYVFLHRHSNVFVCIYCEKIRILNFFSLRSNSFTWPHHQWFFSFFFHGISQLVCLLSDIKLVLIISRADSKSFVPTNCTIDDNPAAHPLKMLILPFQHERTVLATLSLEAVSKAGLAARFFPFLFRMKFLFLHFFLFFSLLRSNRIKITSYVTQIHTTHRKKKKKNKKKQHQQWAIGR